eukprot:CAMPEP_0179480724 /NCGR_PEP_ID=MMETSP0799-20121207/58622_1 /TAXON_ID=46947 /ORGANISM="Geminigera cryophila, Strain CCMP2564" /LENGTH=87 /DNA_ID=CAMNT_0021292957 /DNA_START=88 /DNA_END=351 /DNA_ORIENTATION=+
MHVPSPPSKYGSNQHRSATGNRASEKPNADARAVSPSDGPSVGDSMWLRVGAKFQRESESAGVLVLHWAGVLRDAVEKLWYSVTRAV